MRASWRTEPNGRSWRSTSVERRSARPSSHPTCRSTRVARCRRATMTASPPCSTALQGPPPRFATRRPPQGCPLPSASASVARTARPVARHRASASRTSPGGATSPSPPMSRTRSASQRFSNATRTLRCWPSGDTGRRAECAARSTSPSRPASAAGSSARGARSSASMAPRARSAITSSTSTVPTCGCGGVGHIEAIASGTAIARDGQALLDGGVDPASPLALLAAAEGGVGARIVAQAAAEGDRACQADPRTCVGRHRRPVRLARQPLRSRDHRHRRQHRRAPPAPLRGRSCRAAALRLSHPRRPSPHRSRRTRPGRLPDRRAADRE